MIFEQRVPVLVSEDTIYRREDHSKRLLLYGRPSIPGQSLRSLVQGKRPPPELFEQNFTVYSVGVNPVISGIGTTPVAQPFFLRYQSPPPSLFFDTFTSVYSRLEAYWQVTPQISSPNQPAFLYFTKNRPRPEFFEDHSLETGQTNHPYPHVIQIGIGLFPFTFETPDLCNDIWQEWVPLHPAVNMYPFRQIYPPAIKQQVMLQMFYKGPNWRIEAEPIWNVPATNNQTLTQFRWQVVIPTLPNVVGDTQAVAISVLNGAGFFNVTVVLLPSITVPAGIVISQVPVAGPVASFTIPVTINVSVGNQPAGTVIMPNVVGVILREAIQLLQDAGVYIPSKIGYFGTDPISVIWLPLARGRKNAAYVGDFGIVHVQSPAAGTAIKPNSPITLTVSSYPENVSFN